MYAPITKERAAADRRMVDVIRECFGMSPLYKADPKERRTEEERFAVDTSDTSAAFDFSSSWRGQTSR